MKEYKFIGKSRHHFNIDDAYPILIRNGDKYTIQDFYYPGEDFSEIHKIPYENLRFSKNEEYFTYIKKTVYEDGFFIEE